MCLSVQHLNVTTSQTCLNVKSFMIAQRGVCDAINLNRKKSVGRSVGRSAGGRPVGRPVGRLVGRSVGRSVGWSGGQSVSLSCERVGEKVVDSLKFL